MQEPALQRRGCRRFGLFPLIRQNRALFKELPQHFRGHLQASRKRPDLEGYTNYQEDHHLVFHHLQVQQQPHGQNIRERGIRFVLTQKSIRDMPVWQQIDLWEMTTYFSINEELEKI